MNKATEAKREQWFKRLLLVTALGFLLGVGADSFSLFQKQCRQIQGEVLRLHILANSDSDQDQALKLAVRDRILSETGSLFNHAGSGEEARLTAEENLDKVEEAARTALAEQGSQEPVKARVVRMFFDTRVYEDFTMPAGWYDALQVVIGEGEGHNWWCVLYPPLCLSAAEAPKALTAFTPEERTLLESSPKYEVRFFLVELAEKLRSLFRK